MREDDRKGPGATAAHMIEMNIEVIHPRLELRESVQPGLSLAPIEPRGPVAGEFLHVVPIDAILPGIAVELVGPVRMPDAGNDAIDHALRDGDPE